MRRKMKIITPFIFILSLFLVLSCAKPEKEKTVPFSQLEIKDGKAYLKGAPGPFTGTAVTKYEDGQLKTKNTYRNGVMESRVEFSELGEYQEGPIKNNEKSGIWISYDENGRVVAKMRCNWELRSYVRRCAAELQKGNYEKALKNLRQAIKIKPLDELKELEFSLPLHQSAIYRWDFNDIDGAIKYVKIWISKLMKSPGHTNRDLSEAYYRLGVHYWSKACDKRKPLPHDEKLKTIEEGLTALQQSIEINKLANFPHAYKALLYAEKAKLDPPRQKEYEALAKQEKEIYEKKTAEGNRRMEEESRDATFPSINASREKETVEIEEDWLFDLFFEVGLLGRAPPPPPPPTARRKSPG